jgi:hypothetical protein
MEEETQSIKDAERMMRASVVACQRCGLQEIRSVVCCVDALLWQRTGLKDSGRDGKGEKKRKEEKTTRKVSRLATGRGYMKSERNGLRNLDMRTKKDSND